MIYVEILTLEQERKENIGLDHFRGFASSNPGMTRHAPGELLGMTHGCCHRETSLGD